VVVAALTGLESQASALTEIVALDTHIRDVVALLESDISTVPFSLGTACSRLRRPGLTRTEGLQVSEHSASVTERSTGSAGQRAF
jgi:hypothetical protein